MIYFDNAATTPLDTKVLDAMLPYLQQHFGNPSSIHATGRKARAAIEKARKQIAKQLNASLGEIFFTSGGTEANNTILLSAFHDLGVQDFITSPLEHHCILHCLEAMKKRFNINVHFVKLTAKGHIDLQDLTQLLSQIEGRKMVSLMYCNNEVGNLLDVDAVAKICEEQKALFHSDTVQSIGFEHLDVQQTKIGFLSGSAHKLHGPKGIGFMYINSDYTIQPLLYGGPQERNMRAGTENVANIVGLGKAVEIAYKNLTINKKHILFLKNYLIEQLKQYVPNIQFNGDCEGNSSVKIVNAAFPASENTDLLLLNLDIAGICTSGGSACSSGVDIGSHVLETLGVADDLMNIRFSFSKYNTKAEIDVLVGKLREILKV
ncbi:MAG: cysteine desulfurase family protein [Chitinophagales bacterium]